MQSSSLTIVDGSQLICNFMTVCYAFVCSQVHKFDVVVFLICNS
jgi:hypothetical protein